MSIIPKVKIEVSIKELQTVNNSFHSLDSVVVQDKAAKVLRNILDKVFPKLIKKEVDKIRSKDSFKLSLEYYEAYHLEQYMHIYNELTEKKLHYIQTFIFKLNEKLA